jgi:hypothetical protein
VILGGFWHVFDQALGDLLPDTYTEKDGLDLLILDEMNMYKAVPANNNTMAWLMMAFPLPRTSMNMMNHALLFSHKGWIMKQSDDSMQGLYQQKGSISVAMST